jgi:hypothetical protein
MPASTLCGTLSPAPELRRRFQKFYAYACFPRRALRDVDDAALLLGLVARVGEEKALPASDDVLEQQQAAVFVGVDCFGFFVEGLPVGIRAVDQQSYFMGMAQALASFRLRLFGLFALRRLFRLLLLDIRCLMQRFRARAFALRLPQRLPDPTQYRLRERPQVSAFRAPLSTISAGRALRRKSFASIFLVVTALRSGGRFTG